MAKEKKYTAAQKKAYYRGQGYRAGMSGKRIPYSNFKHKESFQEGFSSVRTTVKAYPVRGKSFSENVPKYLRKDYDSFRKNGFSHKDALTNAKINYKNLH